MLSEGSDPANPPKQTLELNLYKKKHKKIGHGQYKLSVGEMGSIHTEWKQLTYYLPLPIYPPSLPSYHYWPCMRRSPFIQPCASARTENSIP